MIPHRVTFLNELTGSQKIGYCLSSLTPSIQAFVNSCRNVRLKRFQERPPIVPSTHSTCLCAFLFFNQYLCSPRAEILHSHYCDMYGIGSKDNYALDCCFSDRRHPSSCIPCSLLVCRVGDHANYNEFIHLYWNIQSRGIP